MIAKIRLPFRVASKKNSKRIITTGRYPRMIPSKYYVEFEAKAIKYLEENYSNIKFEGAVYIDYKFFMKGKLDADADNLEAGINDVLEKTGIIDNDKNIIEHHTKKIADNEDFLTVLEISPLDNNQLMLLNKDNTK